VKFNLKPVLILVSCCITLPGLPSLAQGYQNFYAPHSGYPTGYGQRPMNYGVRPTNYGQMGQNPQIPATLAANLDRHKMEAGADQQTAESARAAYDNYANAQARYLQDVQSSLAEVSAEKPMVEARLSALEHKMRGLKGSELTAAEQQESQLKSWLKAESSMQVQAIANIQTTERWLSHQKAVMNNAEYNLSEDEQNMYDDNARIREAQAQASSEQRKANDAAYWAERNQDDSYGGGGYYGGHRGYGHSFRIYGAHSGGGGHSGGGHSSGGHCHSGGGHGGHR
jgi:hypothetical protein